MSKPDELKRHWQYHTANPLKLKFIPLYPKVKETSEEFIERVKSVIVGDVNKINGINVKNLAGLIIDLELNFLDGVQSIRGTIVAELARLYAPLLINILITNHEPDGILESEPGLFSWSQRKKRFKETEGQRVFIEKIVSELRNRYATPFWAGLTDYMVKSKLVLHAMANTDSRTRRKSVTTDGFIDYFGVNYFKSEASATANPLDSLLHPTSTIKQAEKLAAKMFGAVEAKFVTNGTTTSNKVVHQAVCRAGSQVLLDRFCHISHHYGVCMTRSWPVYLNASVDQKSEIPEQITPKQIADYIDGLLSLHGNLVELPRLIALTNCTFDGLIINPIHVFTGVREVLKRHKCEDRLKEIVFLFDEAWFGFARFHPKLNKYSALSARTILTSKDEWWGDHLRVYVTQSMHKTMTAFRQGSMILMADPVLSDHCDPYKRDYLKQRLDNAFAAHTTTSPHAGMISSLDIGRRQIVFEGRDMLSNTIKLSQEFCEFITRVGGKFLTADGKPAVFVKPSSADTDPTKVTLHTAGWITGKALRAELWKKDGVQVNKFGPNSILCIFTIGFDSQDLTDLKDVLIQFLSENKSKIKNYKDKKSERTNFPSADVEYLSSAGHVADASQAATGQQNCQAFDPGLFLIGAAHQTVVVEKLDNLKKNKNKFYSTGFVVPYPPGYPILIPGQHITKDIIKWLKAQYGREIHGMLGVDGEEALAVISSQD